MIGRSKQHVPPARPGQESADPRIWGRHYHGRGPVPVGLLMVVLLAIASYLAYTKQIPFAGDGYTLKATFENATTLAESSPVRIAGVKVGEVTAVAPAGDAAEVTFTVADEGRPIHSDATLSIRPRLFLEGNFFLDLRPGSPSAPELGAEDEIPITQTATAVQLDEVLSALDSNTREDLRGLLEGYGTALTYEPTAADDADQDPSTAGMTAAEALADSLRYGGRAGRGTALVNDALRGEMPGDLARLIAAQRGIFAELSTREAELQGLITSFNTTMGALADEQANVAASIRELGPTLEAAEPSLFSLSQALPPLRELALALEPGVAELPDTIEAGTPWLRATLVLLGDQELGGLARELERGAPVTASTFRTTVPLLDQIGLLGRCVTDSVDPTLDTPITVDPNVPVGERQPSYLDFLDATVNSSGEGATLDGNGIFLRAQPGGGDVEVSATHPNPTNFDNLTVFGKTIDEPIGSQPALPSGGPPPFRMDVDCHTNGPAALNGPAAVPGPPTPEATP